MKKTIVLLSVFLAVGSLVATSYAQDKAQSKEKAAPASNQATASLKVSGMT